MICAPRRFDHLTPERSEALQDNPRRVPLAKRVLILRMQVCLREAFFSLGSRPKGIHRSKPTWLYELAFLCFPRLLQAYRLERAATAT